MRKFLTFLAAVLIGMTAINAEDLYLRGGVNGWNASADYKFTDNGDGTFTLDKTFDLEGSFKFADADWGKVLNFGSTEKATCSEQGVTISLVTNGDNISTDGKLSLTKIVVDKNQKKATFYGTTGAASDAVYTIAGAKALMGADWSTTETANDMTDMKDGTYQLVKENVSLAAGDYEYKAVKNHTWGIWECPSSGNNKLTISEAGTYTVTFTLTPAKSTLTANAVKSGEPVPVETKYYITGNAALVGEEKAWDAQAIEMIDGAYTFTDLAAGEYEMKITNGAWEPDGQSWGSADLSENCSAGVGDKNGNIHFIVETPNNVVVTIAEGKVTVTGTFKQDGPTPVEEGFGIILGDGTTIKGQKNEKQTDFLEYMIEANLTAEATFQLYDFGNKAAWTETNIDQSSTPNVFINADNVYEVTSNGKYTIYLKMYGPENNQVYIAYDGTDTALEAIMLNGGMKKFMLDGQMHILRNNHLYNAAGNLLK